MTLAEWDYDFCYRLGESGLLDVTGCRLVRDRLYQAGHRAGSVVDYDLLKMGLKIINELGSQSRAAKTLETVLMNVEPHLGESENYDQRPTVLSGHTHW